MKTDNYTFSIRHIDAVRIATNFKEEVVILASSYGYVGVMAHLINHGNDRCEVRVTGCSESFIKIVEDKVNVLRIMYGGGPVVEGEAR